MVFCYLNRNGRRSRRWWVQYRYDAKPTGIGHTVETVATRGQLWKLGQMVSMAATAAPVPNNGGTGVEQQQLLIGIA